MKDTRERLRDLDRLRTPDVWARATSLEPRGSVDEILGGPEASKRIIAGLVAFAVFLAAGAFAWRALRSEPSRQTASSPSSVDGTILWPDRAGDELAATQAAADAGDPGVQWRLDPEKVATHFAEGILGWGPPGAAYTLDLIQEDSSPPASVVTLTRVLDPPCPSPLPGEQSPCPPPYEGESISLEQAGVTGARGVWSITSVRALGLQLDLEASDVIDAGGSVSGHVSFPDSAGAVPYFSAAAGAVIGSPDSCSGQSGEAVQPGDISVQTPTYVTGEDSACSSVLAGYVWIGTAPRQLVNGGVAVDPLASGGNDVSPRFFGLTIVPMVVSPPGSPYPTLSPNEPTEFPGAVSSARVADGNLFCTATFPRLSLDPGQPTGVEFKVKNVSTAPETVRVGVNGDAGWLLISHGGQQVADTSQTHVGIAGPAPTDKQLAPGESVPIYTEDIPVIWDEPLKITPVCEGTEMPQVTLFIANPFESLTTDSAAIQRALADTKGAFDTCQPRASGSWVTGTARSSGDLSETPTTFEARCGVFVVPHDAFDVVVLAIVSPPDAPDIDLATLPSLIQATPQLDVPKHTTIAVSWWVYVVTANDTTEVSQHAVALCESSGGYGGGIATCG